MRQSEEPKKLLDDKRSIRWHHNANGDLEAVDAGIHEAFGHSGLHSIATSLKKSGHWDKIWAGAVAIGIAVIPGAAEASEGDVSGAGLQATWVFTPLSWVGDVFYGMFSWGSDDETRIMYGDEHADAQAAYNKKWTEYSRKYGPQKAAEMMQEEGY